MTIAVIDGGFLNADRNPKFDQNKIVGNHDFIDKKMDFTHGDTHGSSVLSTMLVKDSSVFIGTAPMPHTGSCVRKIPIRNIRQKKIIGWQALEYADSIGADVITSSLGYSNSTIPDSTTHGINLTANRHLFPKQPLWEYKRIAHRGKCRERRR